VLLLSGCANIELAEGVAKYLGQKLGKMNRLKFMDGESFVEVEEDVQNKRVVIIQPTSKPVNDNLIELILTVSACKRGGASHITCVIPYYGYAR
jgi:ribose-phosphate pyrophosphokinase